ncbi:MAG: hypothetical protein ABI721_05205 [Candidatus Dojkabacteria bacterium]
MAFNVKHREVNDPEIYRHEKDVVPIVDVMNLSDTMTHRQETSVMEVTAINNPTSIYGEILKAEIRYKDPYGRPIYSVDHSKRGEVNFIVDENGNRVQLSSNLLESILKQSGKHQPLISEDVPRYVFVSGKWRNLTLWGTDNNGVDMYYISGIENHLIIRLNEEFEFRYIKPEIFQTLCEYFTGENGSLEP